jgi:5-epi-alpha-selinene synthase
MKNLVLPQLYCPFPSAVNTHIDCLNKHTVEWVHQFNLIIRSKAQQKQFEASEFGYLAACIYPYAEYEQLEILCDWNIWLFFLDDQFDETALGREPESISDYNTRLIELLRLSYPLVGTDPLFQALFEIKQRILNQSVDASLFERFVRKFETSLLASIWEARNRQEMVHPDIDTYIEWRSNTSGIFAIFALIATLLPIGLTVETLDSPEVEELSCLANLVISFANDIASFDKEQRAGDVHNLVLAIAHERQCSLEEGLKEAVVIHDTYVKAFVELEDRLIKEQADENQRRAISGYAGALKDWMCGNLEWQWVTGRYQPTEVVWQLPTTV